MLSSILSVFSCYSIAFAMTIVMKGNNQVFNRFLQFLSKKDIDIFIDQAYAYQWLVKLLFVWKCFGGRTPPSQGGSRGFESRLPLQIREVAQFGRAPRSGRGGRRFESCLPDHTSVYVKKQTMA